MTGTSLSEMEKKALEQAQSYLSNKLFLKGNKLATPL